jgi:riboflavin kinase
LHLTKHQISNLKSLSNNITKGLVRVLPSLLAFDPRAFGLPPFSDLVGGGNGAGGVVPLDAPFRIKGRVVRGFGRGSRELGIPTANVEPGAVAEALAEAVTGIYAGWASVGATPEVVPMVMSIGFNPFYGNDEKTAEPWLLAKYDEPFYGAEIRLVVCGYIRPEAGFPSLEALVERIHQDAADARAALAAPALAALKGDAFLRPTRDSEGGAVVPAAVG